MGSGCAGLDFSDSARYRVQSQLTDIRWIPSLGFRPTLPALRGGYAFLKLAGKGEGPDGFSRDLGKRFEGNGQRGASAPADPGAV